MDVHDIDLEEKIGAGMTAEVYRGHFAGTEVAVKQVDWGPASRKAFHREMAIMPKINHENLVRFIGACSEVKPFWIVTEYCSGGSCFDLLHNRTDIELEWPQQYKMCMDVASAMKYLHKCDPQIIHRDLKSLNLLLAAPVISRASQPVVKVADFGLSRVKDLDDWGRMTQDAGTRHWMAPEVITGSCYDEKVDVYSYAMILFEVVCREIPFEDEDPTSVVRLTVKGVRPDLEAVPPDCPTALRSLMIQCWAQEPKARPPFDKIELLLHDVVLSL